MRPGGSEPAGRVLVGTKESIATYHMPPMLEFFHHRHLGGCKWCCGRVPARRPSRLGRGALDLGLVMDVETRHASVEASCCAPSPWPPSSARTTCWPHAGW